MEAIEALKRPACSKYVGANAAAKLRELWDQRRITYFNGKINPDTGNTFWATTTKPGWISSPSRIVASYYFFDDHNVEWDANRLRITPVQQRASTLLHEVRHVLCYECGYIEAHGNWDADIIRDCFK
jgi:hypothetical protein